MSKSTHVIAKLSLLSLLSFERFTDAGMMPGFCTYIRVDHEDDISALQLLDFDVAGHFRYF